MRLEEKIDAFPHSRRKREHLAGQRAAKADPIRRAGELEVGLDVVIQHCHRRLRLIVGNGGESGVKTPDVAFDDRYPEVGFRMEMVVDAGLPDAEAVGNVLVAECAVAACLYQRLSDIEDLISSFLSL